MYSTNHQGAQEGPSTSWTAGIQSGRQSSSQDTTGSVGLWDSAQASDFYLRNQLHTYSFGTATRISNSPPSYPPATQDDADLEDLQARADITPRPSVVAYSYPLLPRTSTWREPGSSDSPHGVQPTASNGAMVRANDSIHSSASASVTSFNDSLYASSVVSQDSSSVPHTSTNGFTSSEEDEDRSRRRRSDFSISGPYPSSSANASATSMEFSSEEEYDSDDVPDFEISSARVASVDMSFQEEVYSIYTQERRGSLPMVIPAVIPSISGQSPFGRDREDSPVNVRRPSRSLDDDLSMIEAMRNHSSRARPDDDSLPSPVSMPGSEGDWRNLNARVIRRGSATKTTSSFYDYSDTSSQKQASSSKAVDVGEFDLDWANLRHGIVSMDPTDLGGIVRPPAAPPSASWFSRLGSGGNQSNDYVRRPSVATISSLGSDTFGKAVTRWGGEGYQTQRHDWSFKREKTAPVAHQTPVTSGNATTRGFGGLLGAKPSDDERKRARKEREKEKDRLAKVMASWRGMPIDSQEIWKMDLIGRFRVERRATKSADIAKGPQQRVIVHRLREIDNSPFHPLTVPTSTVHKHSKAVAFSIGRYYRRKSDNKEKQRELNNGGPLITASHPPAPPSESQNRHGSMVLLAPRRVQIAFTNTTSTRKLESHGLLDEDQPRKVMREQDLVKRERERDKRDKNKGKTREKQPSGKIHDTPFGDMSEKGLLASFASSSAINLSSSRATNASGSASVMTSTTMVVSTASIPSTPSSLNADLNASSSHISTLAAVSDRSIADLSMSRPRRRRRRVHDPLELDEEEDFDDDGRQSPSSRTPHSETYGTVDAGLIEQLYHERAQLELDTGSVFRKLFRSRNNKANVGAVTGHLEANYVPPWILLPSRSRQEQQQRVVENLNSSFMDVGLLPSTHKTRKQGQTSKKKRDDQANGILSEVPEDSLYMLLPLWPGETDPISAQDHPHLLRRIPPTDCRQYLLIYYRSMDSRKKGDKKKRASPTVDYERNDRTILLSSFHISARFVSHNELIGTGIRVPEEGLTISGALDHAWETLPSAEVREDCKSDWVIGVCHSRESGIEFIPEGLVKMDLCQMSWKPPSAVSDKYIPPEPTLKLTPIGQAVVEMAWLGAIAMTSFGQVGMV